MEEQASDMLPPGSRSQEQPEGVSVQSFMRLKRQRELDQFIASIQEDDILRLASSYHNGEPCSIFQNPMRGSYNICYFVQFPFQGGGTEKWVVRVPLKPCLAFGGRNKLENEIATMQLVAEKTTIPIPKIHAYHLGATTDAGALSSFVILEYVEGNQLKRSDLRILSDEQRNGIYTSVAVIYIQLRRLEFPAIGGLVRHPDSFRVGKKTANIDINDQELAGLRPSLIQASYYREGELKSADKYVAMLLEIADNAFAEGRGTVFKDGQGEKTLYYLHIFRKWVEEWKDRRLDQGPFTLIHGDLEPYNLIVNENMDIVSVLDWEWSRVVPRQLFNPPLWLPPEIYLTTLLAFPTIYNKYLRHFDQFVAIMRIRERERYGNELLSDEWAEAKKNGGFLVANALENSTEINWFAHRFLNHERYRSLEDLDDRVIAFMQEDPDRQTLVTRKRAEHDADVAAVRRVQGTKAPLR
ncbi:hypothetical protein MKZ38_010502 [Zalerion maritima]|uniref:Aminoglycoside phosphotransferase domain-containing protein n=1 Tax=Zalerion maritima TaxID=339359 RepID=A0AAD5WLU6_9PEZI|nr:hypothetical protein MKZ38_010502 [Zalerion maritima]